MSGTLCKTNLGLRVLKRRPLATLLMPCYRPKFLVALNKKCRRPWVEKQCISNASNETTPSSRHSTSYMPTLPDNPGVSRIQNESPGLPYG